MKFAYFNPTVMAVDDVPAEIFSRMQEITNSAHQNKDLNDAGNQNISIRGGQQIQLVPNEMGYHTEWLEKFIELKVQEYIDNIMTTNGRGDLDAYKPKCISAWTIKQTSGDYQALHNHEAHISGNIYIDVPDLAEDSQSSDSNIEFRLPVIRNPAHLIFVDQWRFQPQPMSMIVFPSYVPHTVYPWRGTGYRTILAFDCQLIAK